MSKLFNALEQIRRNETYNVSGMGGHPSPDTEQGRKIRLILLVVAALVAVAFLFINLPAIKKKVFTPVPKPHTAAQVSIPQPLADSPTGTDPGEIKKIETKVDLNNQGVELITAYNYWQGIHVLKKASEADPGRIEPLINLGVALAELGLFGPANRYFSMAYGLDPEHPELLENLALLKEAGLLDTPLSFYMKVRKKGGAGRSENWNHPGESE